MTDTKHTPGPWGVYSPDNGAIHVDDPFGGICDLYHENEGMIFTKDNAEANAALIAAAPETAAERDNLTADNAVLAAEIAKVRGVKAALASDLEMSTSALAAIKDVNKGLVEALEAIVQIRNGKVHMVEKLNTIEQVAVAALDAAKDV